MAQVGDGAVGGARVQAHGSRRCRTPSIRRDAPPTKRRAPSGRPPGALRRRHGYRGSSVSLGLGGANGAAFPAKSAAMPASGRSIKAAKPNSPALRGERAQVVRGGAATEPRVGAVKVGNYKPVAIGAGQERGWDQHGGEAKPRGTIEGGAERRRGCRGRAGRCSGCGRRLSRRLRPEPPVRRAYRWRSCGMEPRAAFGRQPEDAWGSPGVPA